MAIVIPKNELNEFSLPRVCVTTGQPGAVTFQKVQFQFVPKWIAIFAIAPLIYLIFFFVLRKTATGTLPFSEEGWARVKAARRNVGLAVVAMLAGLFGGGVISSSMRDVGPLVMLVGFVGGLIAVVVTSLQVRKAYPQATFIDDRNVTLKLPSSEAETLISRHLSAGARAS